MDEMPAENFKLLSNMLMLFFRLSMAKRNEENYNILRRWKRSIGKERDL